MNDDPKRAIGEAEEWLISAKDKLLASEEDERAATVCCALAIHVIIRANDALTLKFEQLKATRHDNVPHMFEKLVKEGKIKRENTRFVRLLERAMSDKSGADYGKKMFACEDAEKYVEKAEEFVAFAKSSV